MTARSILWVVLSLAFLLTFFLSLLRITLEASSAISFIRFLEERGKDKKLRDRLMRIYEPVFVASGFLRNIILIGFLLLLFLLLPHNGLWPLWLFLIGSGIYVIIFDWSARIIAALTQGRVIGLYLPFFPLIHVISSPFFLLLGRFKPKEPEEERETTDQEIETFIQEAHEEGIIEKDEGSLLRSVVEFSDTVVREIMTPRVDMVCIREDATIDRLRNLIIAEKYSRIPVYKDRIDNVEGIIHVKDLLAFSEDVHKSDPIKPLIRPVHFVPEAMKLDELLKELQKRKEKMAMVVDEHGGVSGLVTLEDLLEEIVGEIQDEYDQEEALIHQNGPLDYTVSGEVKVEEVEDLFEGMDLAEDDYLTVSGFITHHLGRLPQRGEKMTIKGLEVEVLEVDQKRATKLRLRKPAPAEGAESEKKG
jgi:CBS domain containing-hemolysin-like protein